MGCPSQAFAGDGVKDGDADERQADGYKKKIEH
jgi:hypothetical protein